MQLNITGNNVEITGGTALEFLESYVSNLGSKP